MLGKKAKHLESIVNSIDKLVSTEKEQKLRSKLGNQIHDYIFDEEITDKLNLCDFSNLGIGDGLEGEQLAFLFSTIFPVFIEEKDVVYRLYRHKIEVDLSDEIADRYIFIFSEGRLTSGLFQCFRLYDDEYVYGIKRIINVIPKLKQAILKELDNLERSNKNFKENVTDLKNKVEIAEKNYDTLMGDLKKL